MITTGNQRSSGHHHRSLQVRSSSQVINKCAVGAYSQSMCITSVLAGIPCCTYRSSTFSTSPSLMRWVAYKAQYLCRILKFCLAERGEEKKDKIRIHSGMMTVLGVFRFTCLDAISMHFSHWPLSTYTSNAAITSTPTSYQ